MVALDSWASVVHIPQASAAALMCSCEYRGPATSSGGLRLVPALPHPIASFRTPIPCGDYELHIPVQPWLQDRPPREQTSDMEVSL